MRPKPLDPHRLRGRGARGTPARPPRALRGGPRRISWTIRLTIPQRTAQVLRSPRAVSASRSGRKVREQCGRPRYLGLGDRQEAVNEIGHHFKRLTLLFDHSYRHHVGPSNIPIAVEPQHCRQWFTQIAVGSSQQGAHGGFGSIARRPGIVRWYGEFPGISAPQPSAQRPAR